MFPEYLVSELPPFGSISEKGDEYSEEEEEEEDIKSRHHRLRETVYILWEEFTSKLVAVATFKNIANATFVILVSTICFDQCYSQIIEYLKYETRLQVLHTHPNSTLWLIPGVTICSNNRIRIAKLAEKMPYLGDRLRKVVNRSDPTAIALLPERKRIEIMQSLKFEVDNAINIPNMISESSIPKLIEYSRYRMIKDVNCNGLWGEQFNCENFFIIESYQGGFCNTLFYHGAILRALESRIAYDFNSSLLGGARKIESFEFYEVAEIIIDFEPSEHCDFQRDIGGKLVIHSPDHVGSIRDMAHSVVPGNSYSIIIRRIVSKRLPPPYKSMCFDYREHNSNKFITKDSGKVVYASTELDSTTCVRNCIVRQTTRDCNCWPVEVPYYEGDTMINGSESLRLCSWAAEDANENFSAAVYVDCYKRFHTSCEKECKSACRVEDYRVHLMANAWPTRGMFFRADSEAKRKELFSMKAQSVRLSLKYLDFLEDRHVMSPNITTAQLVSNLGGIISALIGVSLLTVYRYLTRDILHCKVVSDYNPTSKLMDRKNKTKARIAFSRAKARLDLRAALSKTSRMNELTQSSLKFKLKFNTKDKRDHDNTN